MMTTDLYPPEHPWAVFPPDQQAYLMEQDACRDEIAVKYPDLPMLTAVVMGGDLASMRRWRRDFQDGKVTAEQAIHLTGSYFRWQQGVDMLRDQHVTNEWFLAECCDLWRGADPDDTDPANLAVWRRMYRLNGSSYVRDGRPLPKGPIITVYRGGAPRYEPGIAWSTDPKIAGKFANGAGLRVRIKGEVVRGHVRSRDVLAYITGRGEAEVIVDPTLVTIV